MAWRCRPVVQRLDFYGVDFKDFAVTAEPRRLSAWTARVGVILSYSTKGLPNQVAITWDLFNPRVLSARAAVFAGEDAKPCRFTRYQPTFTWKNPGLPPMPEIAPVQAKNPDQKTRVQIAVTLLKNIYRAFDYRDEKAIYDALARSVQGDLLADTYLKIHAGLLMQEQGGAVSHVQNVELLDTAIADPQPASFNAQMKWRVTGTVEHWGHIHTRVNAYEALLRISRGEQGLEDHWHGGGEAGARQLPTQGPQILTVIAISQLSFHYARSTFTLRVPDLTVADGEKVALVGPSGSGKTTLLHLIAGILLPDAGDITVGDACPAKLNDAGRRAFRIATLGLVFQDFQLLESLDVLENILLPYRINPALNLTSEVRDRARQLARETGLEQRLHHRPGRLSQGEKQRTALCRALINQPHCLLADEPTGNLDPHAKTRVLDVLFEQCARAHASLLMVTHDLGLLGRFDRAINLAELSP